VQACCMPRCRRAIHAGLRAGRHEAVRTRWA
jgi:hypothetical protein